MVLKAKAIKNFLTASAKNNPALEQFAKDYGLGMECQVNVSQDGGDRVEGEYKGRQWHGWTDGVQTWKSFRIPYNAKKDPYYTDKEMKYDLVEHAEGIGMTGWNWEHLVSKWVAFDFDTITQHTVGLSEKEIMEVQKSAFEIPWVTVRQSSGGQGLHLYVYIDNFPTKNHNEHSALSRSILGMMSAITGYDFNSKVDICGGNIWVWHRKMLNNTNSFKLIKEGSVLKSSLIPSNWKDHLVVITGKRRKNIPQFINEKVDDFQELCGQYDRVKLGNEHKKLINYLKDNNLMWWWDSDYHMLVTHTHNLKEAFIDLELKGIFDTISVGKEQGDYNCYCFPMRRGSWIVRRFSQGVMEHESWEQDSKGWTKTYLNREPTLKLASRASEGIEHPKGGFKFRHAELALKTAQNLGANISLPNWIMNRNASIKEHKDGRLIFEIEWDAQDNTSDMLGWFPEKGYWKKILDTKTPSNIETETNNYDDLIRHVITEDGDDYGWCIFGDNIWRNEPLTHIRTVLLSIGLANKDVNNALGGSIMNCWKLVNMPFQPEYPGDREWNRNSAKLKFVPSNSEKLIYPSWNLILKHIGKNLNDVVSKHPWAKANGIISGADYLKCWISSLFKSPTEPLPYLFLYGPQNSGKSILHEALSLLMTKGYQRADNALTSQSGFNGELEGSVLCVIEETDLAGNKSAYNKIKDWVTSRHINIRHMYRTPYHTTNTTHWIQCSNDHNSCPVFEGDTRIVTIYVEEINPIELIRKQELLKNLEKEAPDFLAEILKLEIPPSNDRLNVPVIATEEKRALQQINRSALQIFLADCCHSVSGESLKFSELYEAFISWLEPMERTGWTKIKFGKKLPPQFPKGRIPKTGQWYIGNIAFIDGKDIIEDKQKLKLVNGYLV